MTNYPSNRSHPSPSLPNGWRTVLLLALASLLTLSTSCSDDDDAKNVPTLEGKIASYNEFGGATYQEIVDDYLITYDNYYLITPVKDPELCNTLVSMRLNTCLMYYAGVTNEAQLPMVDYAKAFSNYLLTHGMSRQQLDALLKVLTTPKAGE